MANVTPAQIQEYLNGVSYPATKDDLVKRARENSASEEAIATLEELPDSETFENPTQVSEALEVARLEALEEEDDDDDKEEEAIA